MHPQRLTCPGQSLAVQPAGRLHLKGYCGPEVRDSSPLHSLLLAQDYKSMAVATSVYS